MMHQNSALLTIAQEAEEVPRPSRLSLPRDGRSVFQALMV